MKNTKKKGFTLVELLIVIVIIAVLAAVLIPTFSNATSKAKESAAMQNAQNAYTNYLVENAEDGVEKNLLIISDGYAFEVQTGKFETKAKYDDVTFGASVTYTDEEKWSIDDTVTESTEFKLDNAGTYEFVSKTNDIVVLLKLA